MSSVRYRELLTACLAGDADLGVPVGAWQHQPVADQDAEHMAKACFEFQQRYDLDFVKLTPASSYQLRDLGMGDEWAGDAIGRRQFGQPIATDEAAWARIAAVTTFAHRDLQLQAAALVRAQTDAAIPVVATVFSPYFQLRTLAGASWQEQLLHHPDAVASALTALTANTVQLIERYQEAGVDGLFFACQYVGADVVSEQEYADVALPADRACFEAIHQQDLSFVHLHGQEVHAELVVDALSPAVVHLDEGSSTIGRLAIAERFDAVVASGPGSFHHQLGPDSSAVRDAVHDLRHRFAGRPFIAAPGCALPLSTPPLLIEEFISAAREQLS